jgi:hypothetical protein
VVLPLVRKLDRHYAHHERIYKLVAPGKATAAQRAIAEDEDPEYAEALLRKDLESHDTTLINDEVRRKPLSTHARFLESHKNSEAREEEVGGRRLKLLELPSARGG